MKTLDLPSLSTHRSLPRPQLRGAGELTPTRKTALAGILLLALAMVVAWFVVLKPRVFGGGVVGHHLRPDRLDAYLLGSFERLLALAAASSAACCAASEAFS